MGCAQVLEVAADLVAPPGQRHGLHQRHAGGVKARVLRFGPVPLGQGLKAGLRGLGGGIGWGVIGSQCVVYRKGLGRPAAHQRQVPLAHCLAHEGHTQRPGGIGMQGQYQHAAGAFVEAVHRMHPLADLVAQRLHHPPGFAGVQPRCGAPASRRA
jgi:hypothetical protein